jgi:hypothetical protein
VSERHEPPDPPTLMSALALGLLFPGLETMRRGFFHWTVDFTTMFEDYLAGALLLAGAIAAWRRLPWGLPLLSIAWAYATGMMGGSFWHQVEATIRGIDLEPGSEIVVAVKAVLWSTCAISTVRCLHALTRR